MLVAYVKITIDENDRQTALDALLAEVPVVRAMAGCVTFSPLIDPTEKATLFILHEWELQDYFTEYLSSQSFAKVNSMLGPLFSAPVISRRFDARIIQ